MLPSASNLLAYRVLLSNALTHLKIACFDTPKILKILLFDTPKILKMLPKVLLSNALTHLKFSKSAYSASTTL